MQLRRSPRSFRPASHLAARHTEADVTVAQCRRGQAKVLGKGLPKLLRSKVEVVGGVAAHHCGGGACVAREPRDTALVLCRQGGKLGVQLVATHLLNLCRQCTLEPMAVAEDGARSRNVRV